MLTENIIYIIKTEQKPTVICLGTRTENLCDQIVCANFFRYRLIAVIRYSFTHTVGLRKLIERVNGPLDSLNSYDFTKIQYN